MKIRPVGAELFQEDKHDRTVIFRKSANAPNNQSVNTVLGK